jgi:hypothetical protein
VPRTGSPATASQTATPLFTIPKRLLEPRRGALGPDQLRRLNDALRVALELD